MPTEVQVFDGEGIDWHTTPAEGPHITIVTVMTGRTGIKEPCRVWVQHSANGGGGVRFLSISQDNPVANFLNTMFSKANNPSTKSESSFNLIVGVWHCTGCQVISTNRTNGFDTIVVNVTNLDRSS